LEYDVFAELDLEPSLAIYEAILFEEYALIFKKRWTKSDRDPTGKMRFLL
jgi:hypothetical protein